MIRVLFICHGNICRSTMAQFVFQDMVNKRGLSDQFTIDSKATSTEGVRQPAAPRNRAQTKSGRSAGSAT